jgi:uncharacterized repeat protein (TIGR03943 family)
MNHTTAQRPAEPPLQWPALIETVLLGSATAMLLSKTARGALVFYIHPRYTWLVVAAALVLGVLALVRARAIFAANAEPGTGQPSSYMIVALAVLLGTLVPARPLGANTVSASTIGARTGTVAQMPQGDSRSWDLLQWSIARSVEGTTLAGKPVDVVGFVFHEPGAPADRFVVARYVLTCCTADGSATGMPVVWQGGASLPADTWVRVSGTIGSVTRDGVPEPAIVAEQVEVVSQPKMPYLYSSQ